MNAQLTKAKDMTLLSLMLEFERLQDQPVRTESDTARLHELKSEITHRTQSK